MGDLRQPWLGIVAGELLEDLGRDAVQLGAAGGAEALQQRVADERVLEGEAAGILRGDDDPRPQRALEALEDHRLRRREHAGERRQPELAAEDRAPRRACRSPRRRA